MKKVNKQTQRTRQQVAQLFLFFYTFQNYAVASKFSPINSNVRWEDNKSKKKKSVKWNNAWSFIKF